jgi:hypothetical protein
VARATKEVKVSLYLMLVYLNLNLKNGMIQPLKDLKSL